MRIMSVNVGSVRQLGRVRGKRVYSGFVKKPVSGAVRVGSLNLEGDRQADLTVHGGVDKAVYSYPSEHYQYWVAKISGYGNALGNLRRKLHHRRVA